MKTVATERVVCIKIAITEQERDMTRQLRCEVFCREQRIFANSDLDAIDAIALPLVALCQTDGVTNEAIGTVRIHEAARGLWFGSRLAVTASVRRSGAIGTGLIRLAVGIAHAHGCKQFLAHVQSQNVPLFERLHWQSLSEEVVHGRPHHLMQANLAHYPPIVDGDIGLLLPVRSS